MLDKFKRPDDHPEYYRLYGIPRAVAMTLYGAGVMSGKFPAIDAAAATLSGLLCIGDIGGLASQSRTRLGAASGRAGVAFGAASILGYIHPKRGQTASIADLTAIITNLAAIIADLTAAGGAAETASATALSPPRCSRLSRGVPLVGQCCCVRRGSRRRLHGTGRR
uniref:proton-translocating NAD(P)(+) transhydrogenase n=1 Tax=Odontella aurita TaxID=265563 RepID=A0A7S4IYB2_9STRA